MPVPSVVSGPDVVTQQVTGAVASGGVSAGTGLLTGALTAGIGFGVSYGISQLVGYFTRRNRRKEEATAVVNEAEVYLKGNLASFQNGDVGKQEAVNNFNQLWNYVVLNCGKVGGSPGERCISERQRGGRFDWFAWYLDPIANAVEEEGTVFVGAGTGGGGGLDIGLVLAVGLLGLGVFMFAGGGR